MYDESYWIFTTDDKVAMYGVIRRLIPVVET